MSPNTTIATEILLRVLAAVIGVLFALLTGAGAVALSRRDGDSWPTALRHGGKTFAATVGVLAILYGVVVTV
ncbi:hypothetical protein ACIA8C_42810 [Nocardia sp. NPDC051321]|uniref:hypothetical protein n=1 Tax=Nocardia sp. NPDC051321 TaxID=3364323 RepID=UPI003787EA29